MTRPLTEAQKVWHAVGNLSKKPSPLPKGKIAPRNCHPAHIGAAANSTGPTCIRCGNPRQQVRLLHCDECAS
jgi:hypothetical protein